MKQEPYVRLSTRITKEQQKFIKVMAKKNRQTEGEIVRQFIEEALIHYK